MHPYLAEFVGTAVLLLLGNGVVCNVVLRETKGHASGWLVIATGWGLAVFVAVAMVGRFSGAHINPAVTVGLAAAERFPWAEVVPYIAAQFAGAFVGTTLAFAAYYQHYQRTQDPGATLATFATAPAIRSPGFNILTEAVGTFALVFAILLFATEGEVDIQGRTAAVGLGSLGALPAGLLVFCIGLGLGGPTGYAINPARDLGPRLAHAVLPVPGKGGSDWGYAAVPVVGPIIGGALAALAALAMGV
jgi:glycerol uptake facilitator protein